MIDTTTAQAGHLWACMACGRVTEDGAPRSALRHMACIAHAVQWPVDDWHRAGAPLVAASKADSKGP